ncbi:VQ protein [Dillenia turbinata]|uniref:VQ protein n=1 Tax=Dillenia turbinata TaxID=194707 RepID=A0AAN8VJD0_9MAGN
MSKKPTKVVFIHTEYVETDANSFKYVVQKLTGKDAVITRQAADNKISKTRMVRSNNERKQLLKDLSFNDFDKFLTEMPLEELYRLWAGCLIDCQYI